MGNSRSWLAGLGMAAVVVAVSACAGGGGGGAPASAPTPKAKAVTTWGAHLDWSYTQGAAAVCAMDNFSYKAEAGGDYSFTAAPDSHPPEAGHWTGPGKLNGSVTITPVASCTTTDGAVITCTGGGTYSFSLDVTGEVNTGSRIAVNTGLTKYPLNDSSEDCNLTGTLPGGIKESGEAKGQDIQVIFGIFQIVPGIQPGGPTAGQSYSADCTGTTCTGIGASSSPLLNASQTETEKFTVTSVSGA